MSWLNEIIEVFNLLGGDAKYSEVYELIRIRNNMNLTASWDATVRRTIETHSSDSDNFKRGNGLDCFYKIGRGHWGLRDKYKSNNIKIKPISQTENLINLYPKSSGYNDQEAAIRNLREINQIKRNLRIVNALKSHYDFKCQICSIEINLKNGDKYIEVHHLRPLGAPHNGPDIVENMIVVCPNCHVLLDYKSRKLSCSEISLIPPHEIDKKFLDYQNSD